MNVELLQYPEDPERAVATAARLCYAPVGAKELMETMPPERVTPHQRRTCSSRARA